MIFKLILGYQPYEYTEMGYSLINIKRGANSIFLKETGGSYGHCRLECSPGEVSRKMHLGKLVVKATFVGLQIYRSLHKVFGLTGLCLFCVL